MLPALLLAGALAGSTLAPGPVAAPPRRPVDLAAISALVERVVPGHGRDFRSRRFPTAPASTCSRWTSDGASVVLRGSSGVAIASALNWYLEHVAGVNVSLPLQPIRLGTLPAVPAKVRISTRYRIRYFFNYCTFSYSMAWWDWDEWERMIDWMALKGINMPRWPSPARRRCGGSCLRDLGFSAGSRSTSSSSALPISPGDGWGTSTDWAVRCPNRGSTATSPSSARSSPASARSA